MKERITDEQFKATWDALKNTPAEPDYDPRTGKSAWTFCFHPSHRLYVEFDPEIPAQRHGPLLQAIVEKFF